MKLFYVIAAALAALFATPASAECGGNRCIDVMIERIAPQTTNLTYISTSGNEDLLDCDPGSHKYIRLNRADVRYDDSYAMLLTAHAQGAPISIALESGTSSCTVNFLFWDK